MNEHPDLPSPEFRTDAQKFEDALRTVLTTTKEEVEARIEAARKRAKDPKKHPYSKQA